MNEFTQKTKVSKELVEKLLAEERAMRAKQPEAWTKTKYRLHGLYRQTKENMAKKRGGKENMTNEDRQEAYNQAIEQRYGEHKYGGEKK